MLHSDHISQVPTTNPSVLAFRVRGGVEGQEFSAVAEITNAVMDRQDRFSLLFILEDFGLTDAFAGFTPKSLGAQFRSVTHLDRYAVVGAPTLAAAMIETFDKLSPINARAFDPDEEDAAWAFVGARPAAEPVT